MALLPATCEHCKSQGYADEYYTYICRECDANVCAACSTGRDDESGRCLCNECKPSKTFDLEAYTKLLQGRALAAAVIVSASRMRLPPDVVEQLRSHFDAYDAAEAAMDRALGMPEAKR